MRATEIHEGYYFVECAVPIQTEGLTLQAGHIIGFDVSVDDDFDGDNIRDEYSTWANLGQYWSKTCDLANIMLERVDEDTEDPAESETTPAGPSTNPVEPTVPETELAGNSDCQSGDNMFVQILMVIWNFILKVFGII